MVYWNRFISYIYRYHDGSKCENTGFAKVAKIGRNGRITIGLRTGDGRDNIYGVYIYRETLSKESPGNPVMIPLPVLIGRIKARAGQERRSYIEETFSFRWDDVGDSGRPITAFAGIVIKSIKSELDTEKNGLGTGDGYHRLSYSNDIFCSSWTDSVVDYSRVWDMDAGEKEDKPDSDRVPYISDELQEAVREVSITDMSGQMAEGDKSSEKAEDSHAEQTGETSAIENMFQKYEHLPLLPGSFLDDGLDSVIESVRITPNDIGLLDMSNWRLGVNSFLTHGYYNYKYLMLGKVVFKPGADRRDNCYILGVPGVYSSREKYLAGIFGFDRFVPEKETHIKTGNFGYWIVDINNETA